MEMLDAGPRNFNPDTAQNAAFSVRGTAFDMLTYFKVLCRLIALHSQPPRKTGSLISIAVGGGRGICQTYRFRLRYFSDVGQNVACAVFQYEGVESAVGISQRPFPLHPAALIVAFNWFNPRGCLDTILLGLQWSLLSYTIDKDYGFCSGFSMRQAHRFLEDVELFSWFQAPKLQSQTQIILTGFSMGSTIAHAFAVLLKKTVKVPNPVACVGFGGPRPGTPTFTEWAQENLAPISGNVVLAIEDGIGPLHRVPTLNRLRFDPVVLSSSTIVNGYTAGRFDVHPYLWLLINRSQSGKRGSLFYLGQTLAQEFKQLKSRNTDRSGFEFLRAALGIESRAVNTSSVTEGSNIHAISKYYETLCDVII